MSTIADRVRSGEILRDELIIDCHAHMGPWFNFAIVANDAAGMIRTMDLCGIDTIVSSPHTCIGPDYRAGNEEAMAAAAEHPGRIVPYVTVNPNYPADEIRGEIARWEAQGPLKGFKIHPSCHQKKADCETYRIVWEHAQAHSLPVLCHSWAGDSLGGPKILAGLADEYPQVSVLVAHSATNWDMIDEACAEAAERDNLCLDMTGSALLYLALETMVDRVGAEKVLYGSDIPFIDPRPGLGRVALSRLSDDDKRKVLGLNAQRIFRL